MTKAVRKYLKLYREYTKLSFEARDSVKGTDLYAKLTAIRTNKLSSKEMDEIDTILNQEEYQ